MKNFNLEKGIEQVKKIKMTAAEKSVVLGHILDSSKKTVPSPWTLYSFKVWIEQNRSMTICSVIALILIVSSTNIAFAAKGSLPGDLLYPIKTQVIEPIEGTLAITPTAKAKFNVSIADTRLQEAEVLAAQGRLDSAKEQQIEASFNVHTSLLSSELDTIQKADASISDAIRASFQADMNSRADVIDTLAIHGAIAQQDNQNYSNKYSPAAKNQMSSPATTSNASSSILQGLIDRSTDFGFSIARIARSAGSIINHNRHLGIGNVDEKNKLYNTSSGSTLLSTSSVPEMPIRSNPLGRQSIKADSSATVTNTDAMYSSDANMQGTTASSSQGTAPEQEQNAPQNHGRLQIFLNDQEQHGQPNDENSANNSRSYSSFGTLNSAAAAGASSVSGSVNAADDEGKK